MQMLKKLTVKGILGDKPQKVVGNIKEKTHVARFYGVATGLATGETDNGPWVKLKGEFRAVNAITGEAYQSGACIMPDVANDPVAGALGREDTQQVEFAYDIFLQPADTPTGYEYRAEPLTDPGQSDPLAQLEEKLPEVPALENKGGSARKSGGRKKAASEENAE